MAHGRARVSASRKYGMNSPSWFGSVANSVAIDGSVARSGNSHGSEPFARYASDIPELALDEEGGEELLVLSWGGTYGPVAAGVRRVRRKDNKVAHAHLHYLNPFPKNLGEVLKRYEKVVIPELNLGQLAQIVRGRYLIDAISYNQVRGLPFTAAELESMLEDVVKNA